MNFIARHFAKLFLTAVLLCVFSYWYFKNPVEKLEEAKLFAWIQSGYSSQFCEVILPHMQSCVTVTKGNCDALAKKSIATCLDDLKKQGPDYVDSKKLYANVAPCFQANIHKELLTNFLVDSDECRKMLS
jgi:hypothetical protein